MNQDTTEYVNLNIYRLERIVQQAYDRMIKKPTELNAVRYYQLLDQLTIEVKYERTA